MQADFRILMGDQGMRDALQEVKVADMAISLAAKPAALRSTTTAADHLVGDGYSAGEVQALSQRAVVNAMTIIGVASKRRPS